MMDHSKKAHFFQDLFEAPPPRTDEIADDQRMDRLSRNHDAISTRERGYQPFYGYDEHYAASHRNALLDENARLVVEHFAGIEIRDKIRVLDIGSNAGYVAMKIAEQLPSTIGFEVSREHVELSQDLAHRSGSPARFYEHDILQIVEDGAFDLNSIDCILFLNVVHQLIFARGLSFVKMMFRKVMQSIDVCFVELAQRAEYITYEHGDRIPVDPIEVFAECGDCDIDLITSRRGRPIYKLVRRALNVGPHRFEYSKVMYSSNYNQTVNRKYYQGRSSFLKQYRFNNDAAIQSFRSEVASLLKIIDLGIGPKIRDWASDQVTGKIIMDRVFGPSLAMYVNERKDYLVESFAVQLMAICGRLAEVGLYQNDLSPHNFVMIADQKLALLDYEQVQPVPYLDHFAMALWLLASVHSRNFQPYYDLPPGALVLNVGEHRVDRVYYPDTLALKMETGIATLVQDAERSSNWFDFVRRWANNVTVEFKD